MNKQTALVNSNGKKSLKEQAVVFEATRRLLLLKATYSTVFERTSTLVWFDEQAVVYERPNRLL